VNDPEPVKTFEQRPAENQPPQPAPRKIDRAAGLRSARQFPWTKAEDALLGTLTDRELAEKLHRTVDGVRDRRKSLGKPALGHAPQPLYMERVPRSHHARLFATKSDQELRGILGWSYRRIQTRRRQLASRGKRKMAPEWSLEEDRMLGSNPDPTLARKIGRTVTSVRGRRGVKRVRVKKDWRPEDDRVLGTRTDGEIALLLGRSVTNVAWRRKKLGIAAKAAPRPWTPEEEALLGSKPDRELARAFGRTVIAVAARRIGLGRSKPDSVYKIVRRAAPDSPGQPSAGPGNGARPASYCTWTPEEDALLGQFSDQVVAERLGYPVTRVCRRRQLLGLPSGNPEHRHWTSEEIALLGTRPDREVGKLVNRSPANVQNKRLALGIPFQNPRYETWKPEELALLGTLPDEEVARRTGHSLPAVRRARTKRGIRSARPAAPNWRPEEEALLGTAPDEEIAARLGRTLIAVRQRRTVRERKP